MDVACPYCGALHWIEERLTDSSKCSPRFGTCCLSGKVQLPPLEDVPQPLQQLLVSDSPDAVKFRDEIWKYNRAFAFTSLGVEEDHSVNRGRGPPVFCISGELHHRSGALAPLKDACHGMPNSISTSRGLLWMPACNRIRVWTVK